MADRGIKIGNKTFTLEQYIYDIKKSVSIKLKRAMPKRLCRRDDCRKPLPKHIDLYPTNDGLKWYGYYGYQKGGCFCTKGCSDLWNRNHYYDYGMVEDVDCVLKKETGHREDFIADCFKKAERRAF